MSFASKMLHTIDPKHPIWDSVVTKQHFKINPPFGKKDRENACCVRYDHYESVFLDFMKSEEGQMIVQEFD